MFAVVELEKPQSERSPHLLQLHAAPAVLKTGFTCKLEGSGSPPFGSALKWRLGR